MASITVAQTSCGKVENAHPESDKHIRLVVFSNVVVDVSYYLGRVALMG